MNTTDFLRQMNGIRRDFILDAAPEITPALRIGDAPAAKAGSAAYHKKPMLHSRLLPYAAVGSCAAVCAGILALTWHLSREDGLVSMTAPSAAVTVISADTAVTEDTANTTTAANTANTAKTTAGTVSAASAETQPEPETQPPAADPEPAQTSPPAAGSAAVSADFTAAPPVTTAQTAPPASESTALSTDSTAAPPVTAAQTDPPAPAGAPFCFVQRMPEGMEYDDALGIVSSAEWRALPQNPPLTGQAGYDLMQGDDYDVLWFFYEVSADESRYDGRLPEVTEVEVTDAHLLRITAAFVEADAEAGLYRVNIPIPAGTLPEIRIWQLIRTETATGQPPVLHIN